jgi:hypothetical protein
MFTLGLDRLEDVYRASALLSRRSLVRYSPMPFVFSLLWDVNHTLPGSSAGSMFMRCPWYISTGPWLLSQW